MKYTKKYTIKFSYGGVSQTNDFYEADGVIHNPSLSVSWGRGEIPSVSDCKTIDEVLEIIKSFAYGKRAEITSINGMPVFYYNRKKTHKLVNDIRSEMDNFREQLALKFFQTELRPLLKKNKWFVGRSAMCGMLVLIENKKGEWNNVRNEKKEKEFEYLCEQFLSAICFGDEDKFITATVLNLVEEHLTEFLIEDTD